jgi:uncharacterized protein (TIGR02680 family)
VTSSGDTARFRLCRSGILNVWQYDEQIFTFAGGRLLLRGANGAGKSKTLEMLLPFVLDGDKLRMTASGRHHTSLLWLMTDGYAGASRTGYLWVEFTRQGEDGETITVTCGVGIRASESARQATAWFFTSPRQVGRDLLLEDESGPLSMQRLRAEVETDGHFFESAPRYRDHVGQLLFGLPPDQYADLLRLLYWLRQPQVGEDIEPERLATQLEQALPQVDDGAVRIAGDTFDELEAFGEQIARRDRAATAVADFVRTYAGYAQGVLRVRAEAVVEADRELRQRRSILRTSEKLLPQVEAKLASTRDDLVAVTSEHETTRSRIAELEKGPEARAQQRITELSLRVSDLQTAAKRSRQVSVQASSRAVTSAKKRQDARDGVVADSTRLHGELIETAKSLGKAGCAAPFAIASELAVPPDAPGPTAGVAAAEQMTRRVSDVRPALGELRAAVVVVQGAQQAAEEAHSKATAAEQRAAEVEERAEHATQALRAASSESRTREQELDERLHSWLRDDYAVELVLPELTGDNLAGLEALVRSVVAPVRARHEEARGVTTARVREGEERTRELSEQRAAVEAVADPSPTEPHWLRDSRVGLEGAPLWQLVEFRESVSLQQQACVEAALEGAGLLDAWVHPTGRVVDGTRRDVTLQVPPRTAGAAAGASTGSTVAEVLRPDLPDGCAVPGAVIESLLACIGLDNDQSEVGVTLDGRWHSGPAEGRTEKERAQYIGATARAAERQRRLQRLDEELAVVATDLRMAREALAGARAHLAGIEEWTASRPRHEQVLQAWVRQSAAEQAAERVQRELEQATAWAKSERAMAVARQSALEELAATHSLPTTFSGLAARREVLVALALRLDGHEIRLAELARRLAEWTELADQARGDDEEAQQRLRETAEFEQLAKGVSAEYDELRSAVGASVLQLEQRLADLRRLFDSAAAQRAELQSTIDSVNESIGTTRAQVQRNVEAVCAGEPVFESARMALAALAEVPGLMAAGLGSDGPGLQGSDIAQANTRTATAILGVESQPRAVDANAVLAASRDLQSGPAATLEPRVAEIHGVLTAVGQDDSAEIPLVELAERLRVSVAADRELLTERERRLFEDHVLGHLGDALRKVRLKAEELVAAMNDLLHGVTTSQGIRVRLRWKLRDDIPPEARRAVQLLGEPLGALLADERRDLRESLHQLIEMSRADAPEESYAEHLARALDYRRWFTFRIQYHRPEAPDWTALHRKSPLSQGEQKVLCYLPLFAAAAAHFTSIAGAAPCAPRFVLLDDAFPKIDVRTHPLLFGLLVDLDLDFVITSERLWGDHATVPELAIYEALRSPTERGIAQYEHRWDGHRLTAVGA